jgi:hypothetical protein
MTSFFGDNSHRFYFFYIKYYLIVHSNYKNGEFIMSKQFIETHFCNCREGNIYVKKSVITGLGFNQSQQLECIASIAPCIICGGTNE